MKKVFFVFWALIGFVVVSAQVNVNATAGLKAAVHYPVIPVLKRVTHNPVGKIVLSVASSEAQHKISGLKCRFTTGLISDVDRIELYLTGATPFTPDRLLATASPAQVMQIPFELDTKPGVYFIWVSIVLKESADIGTRLALQYDRLSYDKGRTVSIEQLQKVTPLYTGIAVRKAGDDAVNTYRIPGIVQTDKGTLISVYDIRYQNSRDLPGDIDVGMSRSTDKGKTWNPMKVIMDMGKPDENNGVGDPAILFDPATKKIWVAALWSKGNRSIAGSKPGLSPDTTGQFVLVSSDDDGLTWSKPISITPQIKRNGWHLFFNGPGSGIAMQDGKLVFAAQYWDEQRMPHSTIIYSTDNGKSWKGDIDGPKSNTTESQVVETRPGVLMLNMRDNRGGFRSIATTPDMGSNWVEHATSYHVLQDPVCMAGLIKAKVKVNGKLQDVLFFSNPNSQAGRYDMTVKASLDLGESWLPVNQLLLDERTGYGYSSLTKIDDYTIGILYEGVRDLYFITIPVSDIIKQTK